MAENVPAPGGLLNPSALPCLDQVRPSPRGPNPSLALACDLLVGGTVSTVLSVIEVSVFNFTPRGPARRVRRVRDVLEMGCRQLHPVDGASRSRAIPVPSGCRGPELNSLIAQSHDTPMPEIGVWLVCLLSFAGSIGAEIVLVLQAMGPRGGLPGKYLTSRFWFWRLMLAGVAVTVGVAYFYTAKLPPIAYIHLGAATAGLLTHAAVGTPTDLEAIDRPCRRDRCSGSSSVWCRSSVVPSRRCAATSGREDSSAAVVSSASFRCSSSAERGRPSLSPFRDRAPEAIAKVQNSAQTEAHAEADEAVMVRGRGYEAIGGAAAIRIEEPGTATHHTRITT